MPAVIHNEMRVHHDDDVAQAVLEERFNRIRNDATSENEVEWSQRRRVVSDKPVYSKQYIHCNGVIVFKGRFTLLAQSPIVFTNVGVELNEGIEELQDKTENSDLSDIVVCAWSGDLRHLREIRSYFRRRRIPITGRYQDYTSLYNGRVYSHKSVVAVPTTREVILYSDRTGFHRLH